MKRSRTIRQAPAACAALLLLGGCSGKGSSTDARLCAVLVTLDATRTDALGCYGGPAGVTPSLDGLAARALVYEQAHTVAPLTLPAHASLLTGLYPLRHGVRDERGVLPGSAQTLAELARAAGYQTAAFVAAEELGPRSGLDQGFEVFEFPAPPEYRRRLAPTERPGREVVDQALAWLAQRDEGRPFLLWVHLGEPRAPYEPPAEFRQGPFLANPYLGEVATADREVGRLLGALGNAGVMERTAVLALADHGVSLGEHGEPTHSYFCWETTLRVPFLLQLPAGPAGGPRDPTGHGAAARAGERSREIVSVVDVLPTLGHALGLAWDPGVDGIDLLAGPVDPARGAYFESYAGYVDFGWSPLAGWLDARGKYVHGRTPQLYLLADDPLETRNAALEHPELVGPYVQGIAEASRRPALPHPAGAEAGALPHPLMETGRPSPFERLDEWGRLTQATNLLNTNEPEKALELCEELGAANAGNRLARELAALCLMRLGRHGEAVEPWRKLVAEDPGYAGASYNLGACLSYGDAAAKQEAIERIRRAIELDPYMPHFALELQRLLEQLGRGTEAAAVPEAVRRLRQARRAP